MSISVISIYMVPVPGATIILYNTEDELHLKENPITTVQTDSNGQALFEDLEEQRYYFYVEKDGLDNTGDISATWSPLQIGQRSELVVKIAEPIKY
ncbi:MAG: carboxypeptidase regulatory-like domain-containing protein [Bacteroidetes bacterium]|nr:carboxypeptidase regulatory-like domain-containing protein [Bacteroidota bacterium]